MTFKTYLRYRNTLGKEVGAFSLQGSKYKTPFYNQVSVKNNMKI